MVRFVQKNRVSRPFLYGFTWPQAWPFQDGSGVVDIRLWLRPLGGVLKREAPAFPRDILYRNNWTIISTRSPPAYGRPACHAGSLKMQIQEMLIFLHFLSVLLCRAATRTAFL